MHVTRQRISLHLEKWHQVVAMQQKVLAIAHGLITI
jgi:hypothetical protein